MKMQNLLITATDFENLSKENGKVVKNNDEILKEISSLKDFEDRVSLAEEHFDKLGEGSSRTIFQVSDSLVLKIAHNDKGIAQNQAEMSIHSPCINNVLVADIDKKWIIVRFSENINEEDFENATEMSFKTFGKAIYYKSNNEIHEGKPQKYEEIIKNPLFKCIYKLIIDYDLQVGDAIKISSWGMIDGKVVLRDFGLTKDIYMDFYEDNSDNNTATV